MGENIPGSRRRKFKCPERETCTAHQRALIKPSGSRKVTQERKVGDEVIRVVGMSDYVRFYISFKDGCSIMGLAFRKITVATDRE